MIPGFEKIIEDRIKKAQHRGDFENLPGAGKPLNLLDDQHIPEDLRLAFKILKNADCLPPEIELKKEILRTEDLLANMTDTAERYSTLKKLNFLILKLNATRKTDARFDMPQHYLAALSDRMLAKSAKTDR
jgi:DnaJ homologue, subfamily C, member 28, conserved domain